MSEFEDRLRRALHEYVDEPGPVELTNRIDDRIRQRHQRRRRAGWGSLGVAVAALLVIGLIAFVGGSDQTLHVVVPPAGGGGTVASPVVPPSPGSTGVDVLDLTWISPTDGWLLGTPAQCSQPGCPALILTTNDGGQSWHEAAAPALACTQAAGDLCPVDDIGGIRFATTQVGYLYGGQYGTQFYMTTDGGLTWVQQTGPQVLALEAMDGTAIRVIDAGTGCPGPCSVQVEEAPAGSSTWKVVLGKVLPGSATGSVSRVQLARQSGGDVYLAVYGNPASGAGNQEASLYVSHDGGATWSDKPDPCAASAGGAATPASGEVDAIQMSSAPNGTLAMLCAVRDSGQDSVAVSTDGGETFGPRQQAPQGEAFGVASPATLFVSSGTTLQASFDGGAHWATVATDPNGTSLGTAFPAAQAGGVSPFLGFESATTGRWADEDQTVWTTNDGGHTWTPSPVSS
ncbi:MAG: hypothetical protein ACRDJU_10915 [Actinomycetota bacterium]